MKVLNPTSGFPAWGSEKGTGNPQGIWPWGPAEFDYKPSRGLSETETPVLEGTQKNLHASKPIAKEQWPHRRLNQNYLLVLEGLYPPVEAWVVRGSPQGQGHWKIHLEWTLWNLALTLHIEPLDPRAGSPQTKQLPGREYNPTHQQIIELNL